MYKFIQESGAPIKAWVDGVQLEDAAKQQLINVASLPFIHHHVAAMPDVHWGIGATVGSVIPTKGAIIPAAVGVDIGCGMVAARTSLTASDLPDNLSGIRSAIEKAVPHGRTNHGGEGDRGAFTDKSPLGVEGVFGRDRAAKVIASSRTSSEFRFHVCGAADSNGTGQKAALSAYEIRREDRLAANPGRGRH